MRIEDVHTLGDVVTLITDGIALGMTGVLSNGYGQAAVVLLLVIITASVIGDRTAAWRFTDYDDVDPFLTDEQREQHMREQVRS